MYFIYQVLIIVRIFLMVYSKSQETNVGEVGYWSKYQSAAQVPNFRLWGNDRKIFSYNNISSEMLLPAHQLPINNRNMMTYPDNINNNNNYYDNMQNTKDGYRGNGYDNLSPEWEIRQAMKFTDHSHRNPERGWQRVSSSESWEKDHLNRKNQIKVLSENSYYPNKGYWASQPPRDIGWNEDNPELPVGRYRSNYYDSTSMLSRNPSRISDRYYDKSGSVMNGKHAVYLDYNFDNKAGTQYSNMNPTSLYNDCVNQCYSRCYMQQQAGFNRPSTTDSNYQNYYPANEYRNQYQLKFYDRNRNLYNSNFNNINTERNQLEKERPEPWFNREIPLKYINDDDDDDEYESEDNEKRKQDFNAAELNVHKDGNNESTSAALPRPLLKMSNGEKSWNLENNIDSKSESFRRYNELGFHDETNNATDADNVLSRDRLFIRPNEDTDELEEMNFEQENSTDFANHNKSKNPSAEVVRHEKEQSVTTTLASLKNQ